MTTSTNYDTTKFNQEELPKGITLYETAKGETKYMIKVYGGVNPKNGKSITITRRGFKSLNVAKTELRRIEFARKNGNAIPKSPKRLRYKEVYEMWLPYYTVQKSTLSKTIGLFKNHILPELGDSYIDKIALADCNKFILKTSKKLKKFKLVKHYANQVFEHAIKLKLIEENPLTRAQMPTIIPEKKATFETLRQRKYYNRTELNNLLEAFKQEQNYKHYAFFTLLANTGMRKSEALALTWEDIDWISGEVAITKAVGSTGEEIYLKSPKNGFSRLIHLTPEAIAVLIEWKKIQQKELLLNNLYPLKTGQLIFQNNFNKLTIPTKTTDWLNKIKKKYDVVQHLTTHHLRHTFATHMFASGVDIEVIRTCLGHQQPASTRNYIHQDSTVSKEALIRLSNYRQVS